MTPHLTDTIRGYKEVLGYVRNVHSSNAGFSLPVTGLLFSFRIFQVSSLKEALLLLVTALYGSLTGYIYQNYIKIISNFSFDYVQE